MKWIWRPLRSAPRAKALALLGLAALMTACSAGVEGPGDSDPIHGSPQDAGVRAAVRALFELAPDPMRFGAIPWPDDLYLDASHRVATRELPGLESAREYRKALAEALQDLDGFGLSPTVYFRFDGPLDPASLPADAQESVEDDASVYLLDVDPSSADVFQRIPVHVAYQHEQRRIALRPAYQRRLVPGRRYAAVVTRKLRAEDGAEVAGAERFLAIRDPAVMLSDPLELEARAHYTPVLETLATEGVEREDVVAMAVFHVQTVGDDLADARALVRAGPAPMPNLTSFVVGEALDAILGTPQPGAMGLDAEGGAPHSSVGAMIHGSFLAPNLLSAAARTHGSFQRTDAGQLATRRMDEVYFTLWLPRGAGGALPVALVQHGLGGDRSDALAIADKLLGMGYAVVASDSPFHGLRAGTGDVRNRFTGAAAPDAFGDAPGDFAGVDEREGELVRMHPFYFRDAVRQGAVDLMALIRLLQEGDWSALHEQPEAPIDASLDAERLLYAGVDLGGELGVMLAAHEPSLGALAVAFAGGLALDGWLESPARTAQRNALLSRLGRRAEDAPLQPGQPCALPELEVVRTLLDRGNAFAHTRAARRADANMLLLLAGDDEVVGNRSTEALAYALGAETTAGHPRHIPELPEASVQDGRLAPNFPADEPRVVRVMVELDPATHSTLMHARGRFEYEHPVEPPFVRRSEPVSVDNPIATALDQLALFFESWRACAAANMSTPCAASVALAD